MAAWRLDGEERGQIDLRELSLVGKSIGRRAVVVCCEADVPLLIDQVGDEEVQRASLHERHHLTDGVGRRQMTPQRLQLLTHQRIVASQRESDRAAERKEQRDE